MSENEFKDALFELGITLTENQMNQLNQYHEMLIDWNTRMNLTGITEKEEVYLKHFYDSITLVKVLDFSTITSLCDLGTGAGFPGIVLKIVFPNLYVTLVDSLQKRITFLNAVCEKLQLKAIVAIPARAEEFALTHRGLYDVVTARAVASLPILMEYSIPMLKINGIFVSMKGDATEELSHITKALALLDSELEKVESFLLPKENSKRTLICIKKVKKTNGKYPRKYGEIKNHSL